MTSLERERLLLAPYALASADSAGREHAESTHAYRSPFARDRDRLVHCSAFRRLAFKTQVFTGERGDYHRNRLTHTLEVVSIARTLARGLGLNEDLVEALALLHDLGHPPFGHAGEDALDFCLRFHGGFSHNRQALRIVEVLETRYASFPGLNLSREVLEGQRYRTEKSAAGPSPLLEVQIVEAADSIAYDVHDADDAVELEQITFEDLLGTQLWAAAHQAVCTRQPSATGETKLLRRLILHELIDLMVSDLIEQVLRQVQALSLDSPAAVRRAAWTAAASPDVALAKAELEKLLLDRVYRHREVMENRHFAQQRLQNLFDFFVAEPQAMTPKYRRLVGSHGLQRTVGDYLAGMTDRYVDSLHSRYVAL